MTTIHPAGSATSVATVSATVVAMTSAVGLTLCLAAGAAVASPYTEVASALDEDDSFDLNVWIDYSFELHRAEIKREFVGLSNTEPGDALPVVKDLLYEGNRHGLVPRLALGVFTDLSLSAALPIVLADARRLKLDQRGADSGISIVDRTNSTTIVGFSAEDSTDDLLPENGFDADDPGGPGFVNGDDLFRGPARSGVDQLHLGLTWAPMNQERDDTEPTWKIGGEARLAVGSPMKFDRMDPGSETSVGRGVHEVRLWTSLAKRVGWAEPYVELWWMAPIGVTSDSAFQDLGFGHNRTQLQQRAGTRFGFEAIAWESLADQQRVGLDFTARVEALFEGRDYTEMWEVFAYAGDVRFPDEDGQPPPLALDSDPTRNDPGDLISHPGLTNVENYLRFGGRLGFYAVLGPNVRFGAAIEITSAQNHVITFADAGVDLPTCGEGGAPPDCEDDANQLVNPGTAEVNPTHVELIDLVGRRYRVEEGVDFSFSAAARILF